MRIQLDYEIRAYTNNVPLNLNSAVGWPTLASLLASLLEVCFPVANITTGHSVSINPFHVRNLWPNGGIVASNVAVNTLMSPRSKSGNFIYSRFPLSRARTQTQLDYSLLSGSDSYKPSALVNCAPWAIGSGYAAEIYPDLNPVVPCLEIFPGITSSGLISQPIDGSMLTVANQTLPLGGMASTLEIPASSLVSTNVSQLVLRGPLSIYGTLTPFIANGTSSLPFSAVENTAQLNATTRASISIMLDDTLLANAASAQTDSFLVYPKWISGESALSTAYLATQFVPTMRVLGISSEVAFPVIPSVVSLNRILTSGPSGFSDYSETVSLSDNLLYGISFKATAYSD